MTKVLILSDSHGLTEEILEIKERHQLERMIHCGDSELDIDAPVLEDLLIVAGNCDFDRRFLEEQTIAIDETTFFITHGHLYNVRTNLMTLSSRATEDNAQIICYGHTHIAGAEKIGNQLFVNPGSIRLPRSRVEKTYAIIELKADNTVQVNFYTTDGELVDELTYKTSL